LRDGNSFPVPDTPCIGVAVDERVAGQEECCFRHPTMLRRRDGPFTNW
jgi:hypothetical protein